MADNFDLAYHILEDIEGFYKGVHTNLGESSITYKGIYRSAWPFWEGWDYIDRGEEPPDLMVKTFYYDNFWAKCRCGDLPSGLDLSVFDMAVNTGKGDAIQILQKCVGASVDGIIGSQTLNMTSRKTKTIEDLERVLRDYTRLRIDHYYRQNNTHFLAGWINRAIILDRESVSMAIPK